MPPSYREFLKVSDGWRHAGGFVWLLAGAEEARWHNNEYDVNRNSNWGLPNIQMEDIPLSRIVWGSPQGDNSPGLFAQNQFEFRDVVNDKVLYENPAQTFKEEYEVTTGQSASDPRTFLGQNSNALERLSVDFAKTVVSAVLEAF